MAEWKEAGLGSHESSTPLAPQVCVVSVLKTPLQQMKTQTCRSMLDALNMPSLASLNHDTPNKKQIMDTCKLKDNHYNQNKRKKKKKKSSFTF